MPSGQTWIITAIVSAEVAFWVLLLAGLTARYLLRLNRLSAVLLISVPLVDVALVTFVAIDLARGAPPTSVHALAAVYLGFSIGFGHYLITRVDAWFAHRFANGPKPRPVPRSGPAKVTHLWREWLRVVVTWAVSVPLILAMKVLSGWSIPESFDALWEDELWSWVARLTAITGIWFIAGPAYAWLFLSRPEKPEHDEVH